MKKVYLIGAGPGDPDLLTGEARRAIGESGLVIGAQRLLDALVDHDCEKKALVGPSDISAAVTGSRAQVVSVLLSGDRGFYSGAKALRDLLAGHDLRELPGVSSLQYFCAKIGMAWDDVFLASAHGRDCDAVALVRQHGRVFLLTGGRRRAGDICRELADAGLGDVRVHVGERLSYPDEGIVCGSASELALREFPDLSVLLVDSGTARPAPAHPLVRRLLVAGTGSGVGKTSFTCGLLRALQRRGVKPLACKCGPDYIDPLFHRAVVGVASRNLDLFLMGEEVVCDQLACAADEFDLAVIEGAMGYYDGIANGTDASAWQVAHVTGTPTVLVVDGRVRAASVAAEVLGFLRFRAPSHVAGVVLNFVSADRFAPLRSLIEAECGVPVLGCIPKLADARLASRHLGLVTAGEVEGLQEKVDALADAVEQGVDVDALLVLAGVGGDAPAGRAPSGTRAGGHVVGMGSPRGRAISTRIGVAWDEAFCFYYDETLRLFERMGAQVVRFSPLHDTRLPEGLGGLYLGGGYPELHAEALSANATMRESIAAAIADGLPTVAECGGFMYLHEQLEDDAGACHPMVGVVRGKSFKAGRLSRFGYVELTALEDGLLAAAGGTLRAHEFHYWDSEVPGSAFEARKPQSTRAWRCGIVSETLYAGFPHLCLHGNPQAARRFVDACRLRSRGALA